MDPRMLQLQRAKGRLVPLMASIVTLAIFCFLHLACAADPESRRTAPEQSDRQHSAKIQIDEPLKFLQALSRLGTEVAVSDRTSLKALFGWTPQMDKAPNLLRAQTKQQDQTESNVMYMQLDVAPADAAAEKELLHVFLHSNLYCIRLGEIRKVFPSEPKYFSESINLRGRFERITDVYGASFVARNGVRFVFVFEYQECVKDFLVVKNM